MHKVADDLSNLLCDRIQDQIKEYVELCKMGEAPVADCAAGAAWALHFVMAQIMIQFQEKLEESEWELLADNYRAQLLRTIKIHLAEDERLALREQSNGN